jgi:ABC-type uncharacterized transport system substrate-binding protein
MTGSLRLRGLSAAICAAMLMPSPAMTQSNTTTAKRIVVVTSGEGPRFHAALAGIEHNAARIPVQTIRAEAADAQALHAALVGTPYDTALIALGNRASELVERFARVAPGSRAVHCLVTGDLSAQAGSNVVIVTLDVPAGQYLAWLRTLLPDARRIGILFDTTPERHRAGEFAAALQAAGYVVVLAPVTGPASLPPALAQLAASVDAVLTLPGPTVMADQARRGLLLFSFRHHIPLIGPSVELVRAGALYALDWDYQALGLHCAALALRPFAATRPPPPPADPPPARVSANLRTAQRFELHWSPEILRTVEKVGP